MNETLLMRVLDILFKPRDTWKQIKNEPVNFYQVLTHYALPLVAVPAVCGMLGYSMVGIRSGTGHLIYRIPIHVTIAWAVAYYIMTLIGVYVEGIVINALAASFQSEHDAVAAFKLAVYASTPVFIAGFLYIIPGLSILVMLFALYSIYLLYLGLPIMMATPKDKVFVYLILVLVAMFVISLLVWGIAGAIL